MANVVLVHGFWLGGWAWRDVAPALRAAGHTVYTPSLTGLGDRVHLASPAVNLATHINDIVNLIGYEELDQVHLLGHSGANVVVAGVADQIPERIAQLIYLDTGPLPSGMGVVDFDGTDERAQKEQLVKEQGAGWQLPVPDWITFGEQQLQGLEPEHFARMERFCVPQPWATAVDPLTLTNPAREQLPKLSLATTFTEGDVQQMVASGVPIFAPYTEPNWRFAELPTGHWPMFSEPAKLAQMLADAVAEKL